VCERREDGRGLSMEMVFMNVSIFWALGEDGILSNLAGQGFYSHWS